VVLNVGVFSVVFFFMIPILTAIVYFENLFHLPVLLMITLLPLLYLYLPLKHIT